MSKEIGNVWRDRRGATAVEYGLICALVFIAALGALLGMGGKVIAVWNYVCTQVISH